MTKIRFFLALFACITACSSHADAPQTPSVPAPLRAPEIPAAAQAPTDTPQTSDDAKQLLLRAFHQIQSRKTRIRGTVVLNDNASTWVIETVPPDTRRMTIETRGREMHMLTSGQSFWIRRGANEPWRRSPVGLGANGPGAFSNMESTIAESLQRSEGTIERVGTEVINGHATTIYLTTWPSPGATPGAPATTVRGKIWVDDSGVPYKVVSDAEGGSGVHFEATYEYDDTLQIDLPTS